MKNKASICERNCRNVLLYTCICFAAIMIFLLLNIEPYQVNAFNHTNQTPNLNQIETKRIRVDDIEMAYKMFGKGSPILLINGYSAPLDFWDPTLVERLASNHTVITFDNRGIGNTTAGNKKFSIPQFAQDTSKLLDALKIKKADIIVIFKLFLDLKEFAAIHHLVNYVHGLIRPPRISRDDAAQLG